MTQIVFVPDMAGYSTCSMMTKPASRIGMVGGQDQVAVRGGISARLAEHAQAQVVGVVAQCSILSNIVAPGTSSTPPTMTRPGSPHACASTAWIIRSSPQPTRVSRARAR